MVQIIPRQEEERPLWIDFFFSLSLGFLILCLGIFFLLIALQRNIEESVSLVDSSLAQARNQEFISLEQNMKELKHKVEDFSTLFRDRKNSLAALAFIESKTHPRTFFKTLSFDVETREMHVEAIAENFRTVEEQLTILRQSSEVHTVDLANLALSGTGEISYQLTLTLSEEVFFTTDESR